MKYKFTAKCVLVLLGIMSGIESQGLVVIPETRAKLANIQKAINIYIMGHNGKLPASVDELLRFASNNYDYGNKPLLKKEDLIDTWGEPIEYINDGRRYALWSSGPDRKMGTKDDVFDGTPSLYEVLWESKHAQAIEEQGTNAVQAATVETAQPTAGVGKVTPKRVPVTSTQSSAETDEPAKTTTAPWKILLLIGGTVLGAMAAWRCFRKKKA